MAGTSSSSKDEPAAVFIVGFRTKLIVTAPQAQYFARACGTARFAYNWALEKWIEQYRQHKQAPALVPPPNEAALRRELNRIKGTQFPWMYEVTKCAVQNAIRNLGTAFKNFFSNPKHFKYPKFKKKFVDDSFTISNDQFKLDEELSRIHIPRLGWVRMCERLRFKGARLLSATISRRADDWYVSISCEIKDLSHLSPAKNHGRVGVDLGISKLATLSDGHVFEAPKPLKSKLGKLRKLQKRLSRASKGSQNRLKLRLRVARLHRSIADIRADALHKLTHFLSANYSTVVIEDLNVKGMMSNRHLSRAIADIGFHEFRRQLAYKMALRGGELIVADRFFPSSRLCRHCGKRNTALELSDRQWQCPHCGCRIEDRDLNAALNLYHYPEMKWDRPRTPVQGRSSESTADQAPPAVADHNGELDDHTAGVSLLCAEEEPVSGRGSTEAARIPKNGEEDSIH